MGFQRNSNNSANLTGNVAADAELTEFDGGGAVVEFPLATSFQPSRYNEDKGEWEDGEEQVTYHQIRKYGNVSKLAEIITSGMQVTVEGRIEKDQWENEDGDPRSRTYIRARNVVLPNKGTGQGGTTEQSGSDGSEDEVPF